MQRNQTKKYILYILYIYIYICKKQREVFTWGGKLLQKSFATQIFDRFAVINF